MPTTPPALLTQLLNTALAARVDGRWAPGIGDPSLLGWLTVILYALAGILCLRAMHKAAHAPAPPPARIRYFWLILGVTLLLLCANKQLDLQSWFTQTGKDIARAEGWYESRRTIQATFVVLVFIFGVATTALLGWILRGRFLEHALALSGTIFLICFIVVRATSFHNLDILFFRWKGALGLNINNVMEIGGIVCVLYAAARKRYQNEPTLPE